MADRYSVSGMNKFTYKDVFYQVNDLAEKSTVAYSLIEIDGKEFLSSTHEIEIKLMLKFNLLSKLKRALKKREYKAEEYHQAFKKSLFQLQRRTRIFS